jgi:hypothetical protein
VRTNITITIRRIIIRIHNESACIRAIIRITADIDNVIHLKPSPLLLKCAATQQLKSKARTNITTTKRRSSIRNHNERARNRAITRITAAKDNAICCG